MQINTPTRISVGVFLPGGPAPLGNSTQIILCIKSIHPDYTV